MIAFLILIYYTLNPCTDKDKKILQEANNGKKQENLHNRLRCTC